MKKSYFKILGLTLIIFSVLFFGCKKSGTDPDPKKPDPKPTEKTMQEKQAEQAVLLAGNWAPTTASTTAVTYKGSKDLGDWSKFKLVMSDKKYTTTGVSDDRKLVWPSTGTWSFKPDHTDVLIRNDKVEVKIVKVTKSELTVSFTYDKATNGKTTGTDGSWVFTLKK